MSVVLTTDCGAEVDDQWALAHLALSTELELRGVVTTHTGSFPLLAAPAAESSARIAREVLDHLSLRSIPPVFAGSSLPLRSKTEPLLNPGVDFLLRQSRDHGPSRRLTVLVIGAATDLASALIADATLGDRIQIVAMAFERWPDGTDPFNVRNDVMAWRVLLESRAPIVVGDVAVTRAHLRMTRERARRLLSPGGLAGRYLTDLFISWLDRNGPLAESVTGDRHSWVIWDEVTVAYLLGLTKSEVHARPVLRDDLVFQHDAGSPQKITWITSIDSGRLWSDFAAKLAPAR